MESCPAPAERGTHYPVDILTSGDWGILKQSSEAYLSRLCDRGEESTECFRLTNGGTIAVTPSSVAFLRVHGADSEHSILGLFDPQDNQAVSALYLAGRWWSVDEALRTSNNARQELVQVQSVGEQVVLYLLNRIIYGGGERQPDSIPFLHHPANEAAKILWRNREAAGFYTVKRKGSLCDGCTSQCYQLPVLDTAFVRRSHRRRGLGLRMLSDFCSSFPDDKVLGISRPISAAMYQGAGQHLGKVQQSEGIHNTWVDTEGCGGTEGPWSAGPQIRKVCRKYLQGCPREQDRVWEVEAPGAWNQRLNVWLLIQTAAIPSVNTADGGNSSTRGGEEWISQRSGDGAASGQSPPAKVHSPRSETAPIIPEPSDGDKGQGSGGRTGGGESETIEGRTENAGIGTDTRSRRKRRILGSSRAANPKQVKLTDPHLRD
uniref:protein FAM169B isoform X2 n=1 Tax=Pristiophorus japonicus TaxID=55135 RepID=UPI00398F53B9